MKKPKIARAMDYLDDDLIAGALQDSELKISNKGARTMKSIWTKVAAVAASVAILATGGIFLAQQFSGVNANAIVALDINPSIEIEVNGKEKVVSVEALNADAEVVIGDKNYVDVDLDVVIDALIGSMYTNGYITSEQNSILISVDCSNSTKAATLQENILQEVNTLLAGHNIEASVITQAFDKNNEAQGNGVSAAKATLIQRIIDAGIASADGVPYTYDQLKGLKVNELKQMLESKGVQVGGIQSSGSAGKGDYIGKQQALSAAYAKAGVSADEAKRVEVELDFDDDTKTMLYEIEFEVGELEYEYDVNATTGEIVKEKIEAADDDDVPVTPPAGNISREEAIGAAYAKAGVSAADVRDLDCEFKSFNGRSYYSVEFEVGATEYEYTVDGATGEILREKIEMDGNAVLPENCIDKQTALDAAYTHAGVKASDARDVECELETVNGTTYFSIEFEVKNKEYEYTVNATTGEIMSSHVEVDD